MFCSTRRRADKVAIKSLVFIRLLCEFFQKTTVAVHLIARFAKKVRRLAFPEAVMLFSRKCVATLGAALCVAASPASAATPLEFDGVLFPQGEVSFADSVVEYNVGNPGPGNAQQDPSNALGVPDYDDNPFCATQEACRYVALGDGGSIVLKFTDNFLTGSGTSAADLWIFEIGADVEDTFVDISLDGFNWFSVGKIGGSTAGVDIDAFGYGVGDMFSFVRLTDDTNEGQQSGPTVGSDIDAVGAISTISAAIPEPATWMMLVLGFGLIGGTMRAAKRRQKVGVSYAW
ncbi:MAG: PEPxxWA-CTERM sorting domain-containing protein [Pseudomonadota bacterium]